MISIVAVLCVSYLLSVAARNCSDVYASIDDPENDIQLYHLMNRTRIGSDAKHPVEYATYEECPLVVKCGNILEEFLIMKKLQSIYVGTVYGLIQNQDCYTIKLYSFDANNMPDKHKLSTERRLRYSLQVAQAIDFVLSHGLYEISIKPMNVMFSPDDDRWVLIDLERGRGPELFRPPFGISPAFAFSFILQSFYGRSVERMTQLDAAGAPTFSAEVGLAKYQFLKGSLFGDTAKYCRTHPPSKMTIPSASSQVNYLHSLCRDLIIEKRPSMPEIIDMLNALIDGTRISPLDMERINCHRLGEIVAEKSQNKYLNLPQVHFRDFRAIEFRGVLDEGYPEEYGRFHQDPVFRVEFLNCEAFVYMADPETEILDYVLAQEYNLLTTFMNERIYLKKIAIATRSSEGRPKVFVILQRHH